jgi:hypothetical protein
VKTPSRVATAARREPSLLEVIETQVRLTVVRFVQVSPESLDVQMKPLVSTAARREPSLLEVIDVHALASEESLRVQIGAPVAGPAGTNETTEASKAAVMLAWTNFLTKPHCQIMKTIINNEMLLH